MKQQRAEQDGRWWSSQWRLVLNELGLNQARLSGGRITRLEVLAGKISATLLDKEQGACEVEIQVQRWRADEWRQALEVLSSQALFVAQLLAGDLPPELAQLFSDVGLKLLPAEITELTNSCSCEEQMPCNHLKAVFEALGDMVEDDPWLLFRLRGREREQILRALQQDRNRAIENTATLSELANVEQDGSTSTGFYRTETERQRTETHVSLASEIDKFWGSVKEQESFRPHIVQPSVKLALLRRLGVPPFDMHDNSTYEQLSALYEQISADALQLAYSTELDEGGAASSTQP